MAQRRIIWAVDAFEAPNKIQRHAAETIHTMLKSFKGTIELVYILSPAQLNLSIEFSAPWVQRYRPAAEKALAQLIAEYDLPNARRPTVLVQNFSSTAQAVSALASYAYFEGADCVVVGSHARSGVRRFFLGSFAESLLLNSKVPVVMVGPEARRTFDFGKIVFPTEFGKNARYVFRRIVDMARDLQSSIVLYHAIPNPIEPVFQSGVYLLGGSWVPVHTYFAKETERYQRRANAWARWAEKQGVPTEVLIDTRVRNIAEAIMTLAKRKRAGMIAMDAQSGPMSSALIGSITRQVARHADCPVWVIRSGLAVRAAVTKPAKPLRRAA